MAPALDQGMSAGKGHIPTKQPHTPAGKSWVDSEHCAPTAFSAEMALDGAIDKILYLYCLQPGGPAPGDAQTWKGKLPNLPAGVLPCK